MSKPVNSKKCYLCSMKKDLLQVNIMGLDIYLCPDCRLVHEDKYRIKESSITVSFDIDH
jgi:ribosome-binding protein aMBF1 (putative translation factor)